MFTRRTMFIVGAGASFEVGLPIGADLAKIISKMLDVHPGGVPNVAGEELLQTLYNKHPLPHNGYHRAAVTISDGVRLTNSIDDFLDRHSTDAVIQRVGRAAIVKAILDAERNSILMRHPRSSFLSDDLEKTWFVKLFRKLGSDVKASNAREIFDNVSFVVFNYDRCIEFFLLNALQIVYNISESEAVSILNDLHLIHAYGTIAGLHGVHAGGIPYGGVDKFDYDYDALSANIKILSEQIFNADLIQTIRGELSLAQQLVFLGFGYHRTNLALLQPEKTLPSMPVFATAHKFSDHDREMVQHRLERMFLPPPPKVNPRSPIVVDNGVTCAGLFDSYAQSIQGD